MRKILAITSNRADREPLMPVIKALGENCIHIDSIYASIERITAIKPDIVLLLGDQYKTLLDAALVAKLTIPIAHIHGGDETVGAIDNAFRHAISKLAYWHFPSCQLHAQRIIQMGEASERVFPLGAPGIDALAQPMMTKEECEAELGIKLHSPIVLVCYHPETLGQDEQNIIEIKRVLGNFETIIISGANADIGGISINDSWRNFKSAGHQLIYRETYPQRLWLSLMHYAHSLIGNSSGFIIEGLTMQSLGNGPYVHIIGDRQKGRYEEALTMFESNGVPFGVPSKVSQAIADKLMMVQIPEKPRKSFYYVG